MPRTILSKEEFGELSRSLEEFHGVFRQIWKMGKPSFTDTIPTAAVSFERETGRFVNFYFNPNFYDSLSQNEKSFVICHESLHVMYNHGERAKKLNKELANYAQDIVINESLVENFGFDRDEIDPIVVQPESGLSERRYCWLDTMFKPEENVPRGRMFEFYYELLKQKTKEQLMNALKNGSLNIIVDDHSGLDTFDDDFSKEISDAIKDSLSKEELEKLKERLQNSDKKEDRSQQAGTVAGNIVKVIEQRLIIKKKKWETVIQKWTKRHLKNDLADIEQWAMVNRRMSMMNQKEVFLPSEYEMYGDANENNKIGVFFFLDTSGSCTGLADRFWDAANSLPEDKFDLNLCCFDTQVYETTIASRKLYGFGGTAFNIIEEYIQKQIREKGIKYPDGVFVASDGYGNYVRPEFPKKWHWFLSHNMKTYVPKESNVYDLKDFE